MSVLWSEWVQGGRSCQVAPVVTASSMLRIQRYNSLVRELMTQLSRSKLAQNTITEQRANLLIGTIQVDQVVSTTSRTLNLEEKMYGAFAIQGHDMPCLALSNLSTQWGCYLAWIMPEKTRKTIQFPNSSCFNILCWSPKRLGFLSCSECSMLDLL